MPYLAGEEYHHQAFVVGDKGRPGIGRAFNDLAVYWRRGAARERKLEEAGGAEEAEEAEAGTETEAEADAGTEAEADAEAEAEEGNGKANDKP